MLLQGDEKSSREFPLASQLYIYIYMCVCVWRGGTSIYTQQQNILSDKDGGHKWLNSSTFPKRSVHKSRWCNDFPGGSDSKASAYNVGDPSSIPGLGRSSGEGNSNPLQYSGKENTMEGGAG